MAGLNNQKGPSSHQHAPNYSGSLAKELPSSAVPSAIVLEYVLRIVNAEYVTTLEVQPPGRSVQTPCQQKLGKIEGEDGMVSSEMP